MDPVLAALGPIPKKRGRPPKSASTTTPTKKDEQQKITSLFPTVSKPLTSTATPALAASPSSSSSTSTSTTTRQTANTAPKKRGRPPKSMGKETEIQKENNKSKEKQEKKSKKGQETETKKRRIEDVSDDGASEDDDSEDDFNPDASDSDSAEAEAEEEKEEASPKRSNNGSGSGHGRGSRGSDSRKKRRVEDSDESSESESDPEPLTSSKSKTPPKKSPESSSTSGDVANESNSTPKKRGRKSKAEREELAKQGLQPIKKTQYIKKGQPGYVRPIYNYVRKTPAQKTVTPVVEEESPLFSSEFVILPEWMPSAQLSVENDTAYLPKSLNTPFKWDNSKDISLKLFQVCLHDIRDDPSNIGNDKVAVLDANAIPVVPLSKEAKCHSIVLNAGGPVWNIDWCPVPQDQEDEYHYLAIGSYVSEATHSLGHIYRSKNIIQIWRVGSITEDGLDISQPLPTLCFGIAHEGEAAISMKWCPLGGFAKAEKGGNVMDRLGLLAVSFFDGSLKIFSIPHPRLVEKQIKGQAHPLVLRLVPVFAYSPPTQQIEQGNEMVECGACIRDLSWSIDNDWALLLTGDDDGTLSVWNLSKHANTTSSKDFSTDHPSTSATPTLSLNAHRRRITSVAWSPVCKHQFLSCGQDGFLKFWDLRDPFHPLFTYLIGGAWLQCMEYPTTKLPYLLFGMDDHSLRLMDLKDVVTSVNKWHFGPIWGVSTNLYNCMLATCSADGAVKYCNLDEKSAKKRKAHIVTRLVEQLYFDPGANLITFSSQPATPTVVPAPLTASNGDSKSTPKKSTKKQKKQEEDTDDDEPKKNKKKKTSKKEAQKETEEEKQQAQYVFPHERLQINQVKWNPRARSNAWVAFCGNTGFVSIKLVKYTQG